MRAHWFGVPALLIALAGTGCINLFGGDQPARNWYELTDLRAGSAPGSAPTPAPAAAGKAGAGNALVLLISATPENSFYDTTSIAFSRGEPGSRGYYHYAGWTERPVKRIGQFLERRLVARNGFHAVAQATSGIRGDLLLNLRLQEIYVDAASAPGTARISVTAELVDWRDRTVVAQSGFAHAAPIEREEPAAAVAGLNRALTGLLDELVPWLEEAGAGLR